MHKWESQMGKESDFEAWGVWSGQDIPRTGGWERPSKEGQGENQKVSRQGSKHVRCGAWWGQPSH